MEPKVDTKPINFNHSLKIPFSHLYDLSINYVSKKCKEKGNNVHVSTVDITFIANSGFKYKRHIMC